MVVLLIRHYSTRTAMLLFGSWISGLRSKCQPCRLNVLIGAESGIPHDLLVRDATTNALCEQIIRSLRSASVTMANKGHPRIDVQWWFTSTQRGCVASRRQQWQTALKAIVVPGTPAINLRTNAISDQGTVRLIHEVIAEIRVDAGATRFLTLSLDRRNPASRWLTDV